MPNLNQCTFMGHATRDLELLNDKSGKPYCRGGMAVVSGWGNNKHTSFISVVAFGPQSEWAARDITKGALFIASGELEVKKHEDNTYVNLIAKDIKFIKEALKKQDERQPEQGQQQTFKKDDYSDVPF